MKRASDLPRNLIKNLNIVDPPMLTEPLIQLRRLADHKQYAQLEQACIEMSPGSGNIGLYPLLTLSQAHLGKVQEARETLNRALRTDTIAQLDFDSRLDLAAAHLALYQLNKAEKLLKQLIELQPDHPLALARYGWCLMAVGKSDAAEQQYTHSARLDPGRVPVWTNLAVLALGRNDFSATLHAIEKGRSVLLKNREDLPETLLGAHRLRFDQLHLQCLVKQSAFAEAEVWLDEIQAKNGEDDYVTMLTEYSNALAGQDHHVQAAEALYHGRKYYPDNIRILVHLAELAQLQGHFIQAVRMLRTAISKDKENTALWCELSTACLNRFDKQARNAANKAICLAEALEESPEHPMPLIRARQRQAKVSLAQVESCEENFDISEKLFLEVLEENPNFVPALQGLGQQYMQQGKIDASLEVYGRMEKIDPLKAHSALISARRFPEDEHTLEKMEEAARTPSLEGQVRSGILFQLAAAREKLSEYDKTFELAKQANQASRKLINYDGRAHRNRCFRIRERFSKALFHHRKGCGLTSTLPVYVLGMPRSGTTLVEQILSGHSQIFGAGELGIIPRRIQGLNRWERHVGSGRCYPDCMDDLTPYISQGIARQILDELRTYDPDALHIVDKLPHNFENIGFIKFLFPNAKIISVRRDPRDIAISNYFTNYHAKHGGMGFAYDLTDIGEQLADHNMMMDHWHSLFPNEILEIKYEDVVDNIEKSSRRMLEYIGMDWDPRVLKFNDLDRTVKTASVWQVRQPIYKTSKNRWKHYRSYLAPLIKGTNAKILPDPVEDMITLPVPGLLQDGVTLFNNGDLDGAELNFKKMLHHNPEHAACTYMIGLVYCRKGHLNDGAEQMVKAMRKVPWQKEWKQNLIQVYDALGRADKAEDLKKGTGSTEQETQDPWVPEDEVNWQVSISTPIR